MKYSITIPAYKLKYLKECIDSVLSQTFLDYEVIILNDASPENIDVIISQYNDSHIRFYKNEINVGAVDVVDNWNKCLEIAKGDYIVCIGDDDKLSPYFLEEYNNLMEKCPNLDVYHARTMMIDEDSKFCDLQEDRPEYETVYSMIWHRTFKERIQFIGDFLYKTSTLRRNGGYYKLPLAWESDCITSFIAASLNGIANLHKPTFFYRQNTQSITNSNNTRTKMEATLKYQNWLDSFLQIRPNDDIDVCYYKLLKNKSKEKIVHNEIFMIANDISYSFIQGLFYWISKRKVYKLSLTQILYSCVIAVGLRLNK